MTHDDFTTTDLDFDAQDEQDAANADSLRALVFDLPARPGTKR